MYKETAGIQYQVDTLEEYPWLCEELIYIDNN
jgi:hypothetical protein